MSSEKVEYSLAEPHANHGDEAKIVDPELGETGISEKVGGLAKLESMGLESRGEPLSPFSLRRMILNSSC